MCHIGGFSGNGAAVKRCVVPERTHKNRYIWVNLDNQMNRAGKHPASFLICSNPGLEEQTEITFISGVLSRQEDNQTSLKEHLHRADSILCHNRSSVLPLLHKFVYLGKGENKSQM